MIKRLAPLCALFVSLLVAHPANAAKAKKTFSPFKGTYVGSETLFANGAFGSGSVTVSFAVPKNGKSATITFSGAQTFNGTTYPIRGTFILAGNVVTATDVAFGLGQNTLYPGTGNYVLTSPKSFTFSAFNSANSLFLNGSATVRPKGKKKQTITISATLVAGGNAYVFNFSMMGKAPKLPKK